MAAARRCLQLLALMLSAVLAVSLVGCGKQNSETEKRDLTLEVALYPYVPDAAKFKEAVSNAWERRQTNAKLHFVDWDCYECDPDPKIDVFVFDGVYLTAFVEGGYLLPIPEDKVEKGSDMLPFAMEGCKSNGELYALPQLLCANYLFTRKDDPALSGVTDIMSLYDILGDREARSVIPETNEGLLISLSSMAKTTLYLDALIDSRGSYTDYSELPETLNLSDGALEQLRALQKMGGADQVDYRPDDGDSYARARWFAEGKGRAYVGFSESMAAMGGYVDNVDVRLLSCGTEKNVPMFFTDMVGIASGIDEGKKELAFELANVLVSEEVLTEASMPAEDGASPQYLLTARRSVYDFFSKDYPMYATLLEGVNNADAHVFRLGADVRRFLGDMAEALTE